MEILPLEVRLEQRIEYLTEYIHFGELDQDLFSWYLTLLFSICLFYGLGGLVYEYGWFSYHFEHMAAAMIEDHILHLNHQQR